VEEIKSRHYFIYDQSKTLPDSKYAFGIQEVIEKRLKKTKSFESFNELVAHISENSVGSDISPKGVLFYIHGYQADQKMFMEQSGFTLQDDVFDKIADKYSIIISLQWNSVLHYQKAVSNAYEKGSRFVHFLQPIMENICKISSLCSVSFLCHSMGNRVFQGIYDTWTQRNSQLQFTKVWMMAADLEYDIFSTQFPKASSYIQNVYIYYKTQDLTLKIAKSLEDHPRLGIIGPKDRLENMFIRDVSDISDDQSLGGNLSHHRYYYGSPTIRQEIVDGLLK
jgi:hypothetical protein